MFKPAVILRSRAYSLPPQGTPPSGFSAPVYRGASGQVDKSAGGTTSHTFTGVATGPADAARYNLLGITPTRGIITAVSCNGVSCNKLIGWEDTASTNPKAEWWVTATPNTTGTTGNVVITYNLNSMDLLSCVVYSMLAPSLPSPNGICAGSGSFVDATMSALNILTGGGAVWVGSGYGGANGGQYGFTGTNVLDDYSPATGDQQCSASRVVAGLISSTLVSGGSFRMTGAGLSFSDPTGWSNTVANQVFTNNYGGWPNYTMKIILPAGMFSANGTQCRFVFGGGVGFGSITQVAKAYFGQQAGAGDTYDAASLSQILFGGAAASGDIRDGMYITSDALSFAIDKTKNHILSVLIGSGGGNIGRMNAAAQTGFRVWYKNADEAATADVTSYTGDATFNDNQGLIQRIEVA